MNIELAGMKPGEYRELTEAERRELYALCFPKAEESEMEEISIPCRRKKEIE